MRQFKKTHFVYYRHGDVLNKPMPIYRDPNENEMSKDILVSRGEEIPSTPDYAKWMALVKKKERCGLCWGVVRGEKDKWRHNLIEHPELEEVQK